MTNPCPKAVYNTWQTTVKSCTWNTQSSVLFTSQCVSKISYHQPFSLMANFTHFHTTDVSCLQVNSEGTLLHFIPILVYKHSQIHSNTKSPNARGWNPHELPHLWGLKRVSALCCHLWWKPWHSEKNQNNNYRIRVSIKCVQCYVQVNHSQL